MTAVTLLDAAAVTGGTVAVGDTVKILPSRPGKHDGFEAVVRRIAENTVGDVEIDVFGGRDGHAGWRTFTPARVRKIRARRAVAA